jgi:uncharacterized protein
MSQVSTPVRIVLDTSALTNPDTARQWGATVAEATAAFVAAVRAAPGFEVYMPPSIRAELDTFVSDDQLPADFELVIQLRAPSRYQVKVPGQMLYEVIDDIRARIDRGLRVAEKMVRQVGTSEPDKVIAELRGQYREALRSGLLDSREDVDVILLASELDAAVVSSDRAVVHWAETLGLRIIRPDNLRALIEAERQPD